MESNLPLLGAFIALAWALDALLAAVRSSWGNARRAQMENWKHQPPDRVARALALLERQPRLNATLRFAQYTGRMLAVGLLLPLGSEVLHFSLGGTLLLLVVGMWLLAVLEFGMEAWVLQAPEIWALRLSGLALALSKLFSPLLWLPPVRARCQVEERSVVEVVDEIKRLMEMETSQEGGLDQEERQMIASIFAFRETVAREVMVPRIDMLALEVNTSFEAAVDALLESGFSRVPVYEETVDNVLGLLYAKDLLRAWRTGQSVKSLRDLLRPAYFVPEAKRLDELLSEMQARHIHMALVVDEYGGVAGLVTLEDIVEEIIGEIQDEYDLREEKAFQQVSEDEYLVLGRIDLDDFNELMHADLPVDEADTLGGFIYMQIGRVPTGGEQVRVGDLELTVAQVTGRRIRKVRVRRLPSTEADSTEEVIHAD